MEELKDEFENTALEHMDDLYRAALRMSKDAVAAEDLVQDTYLRAYRFFGRFRRGTSIRAWLFKILKNTFINNINKQARMPEHLDFDELRLSEEELAGYRDPEEEILYRFLDDELTQAIDDLPEKFRRVLVLSDVEGFSYKEIAGIVSCPIGTVMSRIYRGRRLLRNMLREQAREAGYAYGVD